MRDDADVMEILLEAGAEKCDPSGPGHAGTDTRTVAWACVAPTSQGAH